MSELEKQEQYAWERSQHYATYGEILGKYQAKVCIEHARGESLLDAPCGDGFITSILAPHFKHVEGLDASFTHLQQAQKKLPQSQFHHALIEDFTSPKKFDTITMINVLEHLEDPVATLKHVKSLLSESGVCIIHVPNCEAINRRIAVRMGTLASCDELSPFDIHVAGHRRSYTLDTLCEDIRKAGFKISHSGGVFYKTLSTPQIDYLLNAKEWDANTFGWGRIGAEQQDWRSAFCDALFEEGKEHPRDCNVIYVCAIK